MVRKTCIVALFCIIIVSVFSIFLPVGKCEETNGYTLYVGGIGDGNYTTIKEAINASKEGDTIYVYDGTYHENEIEIFNNNTRLIGENKETAIIDGDGFGEYECPVVIGIYGDWITVSGFTIKDGYFGISITGDYNNIKDNIITHNGFVELTVCAEITAGVKLVYSDNNTIENNIIADNAHSNIRLSGSSNNTIYRNNISNSSEGVAVYHKWIPTQNTSSNDNIISENTIIENYYGVHIPDNLSNNILSGNTFLNNNFDIYNINEKDQPDTSKSEDKTPGFELIIILIAAILLLFWKRRRF